MIKKYDNGSCIWYQSSTRYTLSGVSYMTNPDWCGQCDGVNENCTNYVSLGSLVSDTKEVLNKIKSFSGIEDKIK